MRFNLPIRYKREEQDFSDLESQLDAALQPIAPEDDYVRALRNKLAIQWGMPHENTSTDTQGILMLIGAALLSGILVLLLSIRAVLTIAATIGLLHQVKHQLKEQRTTTLPPAF
jgi:hypothetical protein